MHRSKLRNRATRTKPDTDFVEYKKLRSLIFAEECKKKITLVNSIPPKLLKTKHFWKVVQRIFSDKSATTESIYYDC